MTEPSIKRDVAVSMRFRDDDLDIIGRGAELAELFRSEFVRRAALHEAQLAILNETVIRLSPDAFAHFPAAVGAPVAPIPQKMRERLGRKAPWRLSGPSSQRRNSWPPTPTSAPSIAASPP